VVFDNNIWVVNGIRSGGEIADVWYSSDGANWTCATASPGWTPRTRNTLLVFNNKMWMIGGNYWQNDVWNSSDGIHWTQVIPSAPWPGRYIHSSVVYDGKMWVIGGYSPPYFLNDVWCSSDGLNWTQATGHADWPARGGQTSVVFDNKMWVIAGGAGLNDAWYSTNGANWIRSAGTAGWAARFYHTSVVHDNQMWVIGGQDQSVFYNDVWRTGTSAVMLEVPYLSQGNTSWCIATSVSMILQYSGIDRKPYWVAKDVGLPLSEQDQMRWYYSHGLNWLTPYRDYLRDAYGHRSEIQAWKDILTIPPRWVPFQLFRAYVEEKIRTEHCPVILNVKLSQQHAVVAEGVDRDNVYLHDPSGALLEVLLGKTEPRPSVAVSWARLEQFYNNETQIFLTFYDSDAEAGRNAKLSLEVLPFAVSDQHRETGLHFVRQHGVQKILAMEWYGSPEFQDPDYPSPYIYKCSDGGFPHDSSYARSAMQDCLLYLMAYIYNPALEDARVAITLRIFDSQGRVVADGSQQYAITAGSSERPNLIGVGGGNPIIPPIMPAFSLRNLLGTCRVVAKLVAPVSSLVYDSVSLSFVVSHSGSGSRQEGGVVELAGGIDQPQLVLATIGRATMLTYSIGRPDDVTIVVRDVAGRAVRTLVDAAQSTGRHSVTWNGTDNGGRMLPSGAYFCTMNTGDFTSTRKMVLTD
jgi:hypothetical protein